MTRKTKIAGSAVAGFLALAGIGSALPSDEPVAPAPAKAEQAEPKKKDAPKPKADAAEAPKPKPKPQPTTAQENALDSAENYLDGMAFSRTGLIKQLKFEGYAKADARWAVARVEVDWMAEAAESAENYLDGQSFSRSGLLTQLKFEGYTPAQAEHGVDVAYGS